MNDPIAAYLRGYYFDGTASIMAVANLEFISPECSITFWIKPEQDGVILSKDDPDDSYSTHIQIYMSSGIVNLDFEIEDAGTLETFTPTTPLNLNVWAHITLQLTIDDSGYTNLQIFIDGVSFDPVPV